MKHFIVCRYFFFASTILLMLCVLTCRAVTASQPASSAKTEHAPDREMSRPYSVFTAKENLNKGKKIVLISGDEEYRSEEEMRQLGKILAERHGFDTIVLYAIDPKTGFITPTVLDNIPGMKHLRDAQLVILGLRFRNLPDEQMKEFNDYLLSGRPLIATRTSTHAFKFGATSPYSHYSWDYKGPKTDWHGGFGRKILGETWVSHHGKHGVEGTCAIPLPGMSDHPILKDVSDIVLKTDVYTVALRPEDQCRVLLQGQVISGFTKSDPPVPGMKNNPKMPVAWLKSYQIEGGRNGSAFVTTMGSGQDLLNEGFRRMLVNACYLLLEIEPESSPTDVRLVGPYDPSHYGFGKFKPGTTP